MIINKLRLFVKVLYGYPRTGLPRIAEYVRRHQAQWASAHPEKALVWINDFCGGLRFCCDLSEHMGSQIFFKGSYSGGQLKVLRDLLAYDSVFVDVGANQGEFTVCAAGQVSMGHVFAFEPVATIRERMECNVDGNGFENVTIYPVGLSDIQQNDVPIFGAESVFTDGTQHIGLPTLFKVSGRGMEIEKINLRRLDDLLLSDQRVDVIKIDVEGAELAVLRGAEKTIEREKPAIIFEANAETCEAAGYSVKILFGWLKDHGYHLKYIGPDGELSGANDHIKFANILALQPDTFKIQSGDGGLA